MIGRSIKNEIVIIENRMALRIMGNPIFAQEARFAKRLNLVANEIVLFVIKARCSGNLYHQKMVRYAYP